LEGIWKSDIHHADRLGDTLPHPACKPDAAIDLFAHCNVYAACIADIPSGHGPSNEYACSTTHVFAHRNHSGLDAHPVCLSDAFANTYGHANTAVDHHKYIPE
jgi:hypothetical protein